MVRLADLGTFKEIISESRRDLFTNSKKSKTSKYGFSFTVTALKFLTVHNFVLIAHNFFSHAQGTTHKGRENIKKEVCTTSE